MRYAKAEWEEERHGWRSVVQLNIVRYIMAIIRVVEAEMNGDAAESEEEGQITVSDHHDSGEPLKFTDRHQLLMIRLAPLLGVEAELKRRLGAGAEPVPHAPLSATPFDETPEMPNPRRRKAPEFSVRSWKDVIDNQVLIHASHSGASDADLPTTTIANCKDDMKALWQDKSVQQVLQRRKLQLSDSAGL